MNSLKPLNAVPEMSSEKQSHPGETVSQREFRSDEGILSVPCECDPERRVECLHRSRGRVTIPREVTRGVNKQDVPRKTTSGGLRRQEAGSGARRNSWRKP